MLTALRQILGTITTPVKTLGFSASGANDNVTVAITATLATAGRGAGLVPTTVSTGESVQGIIVTGGINRVEIFNTSLKDRFYANGNLVYGRITEAAGVYTLTYYYLNGAIETPYSISGPIAIDFVINYRFKIGTFPSDNLALLISGGAAKSNSLSSFFGGNPNAFLTTNGSGNVTTANSFDAVSVPFADGSFTATNVKAALLELKANPLPAVILGDIVVGDTYVVKPQNGTVKLNLRYQNIDNQALLSVTGNSTTGAHSLYTTSIATTGFSNLANMTASAAGLVLYANNVVAGATEEIFTKSNAVLQSVNSTNKNPVVIGSKSVTINGSVINSAAGGLVSATIKTNNAFYTSNLVIPKSGFEARITAPTLAGDIDLTFPNVTGQIVGTTSGTNGFVPLWSYTLGTSGVLTTSAIQQDITNNTLGVKITPSADITLSIAASNIASAFKTGVSITALGTLPTVNKALVLHAANGVTDNYALEIVAGDITQSAGVAAFGSTPNSTVKVSVDTSNTEYGIRVTNSSAGVTAFGLSSVITGVATTNIAGHFNATGATNNYGLIVEAGRVGVGTITPAPSSLVELASTTQALLITRFTNTEMLALASPLNGMVTYNTTFSEFYGYQGGAWVAFASAPAANDWALNGNTVTAEKSFGTIDNFEVPIIVNNTEVARFQSDTFKIAGKFNVPVLGAVPGVTVDGDVFVVDSGGTSLLYVKVGGVLKAVEVNA